MMGSLSKLHVQYLLDGPSGPNLSVPSHLAVTWPAILGTGLTANVANTHPPGLA